MLQLATWQHHLNQARKSLICIFPDGGGDIEREISFVFDMWQRSNAGGHFVS